MNRRLLVVPVLLVAVFALGHQLGARPEESAPSAPGAQSAPPTGPVAAALAYVQIAGSAAMYDEQQRRSALAGVVDPESPHAELLDRGFRAAALTLLESPSESTASGLVARVIPVGYRVISADDTTATVDVWCLGMLGIDGSASPLPVQHSWSTETVDLRRTPTGWLVVGGRHVDGPAPIPAPGEPAAPGALARMATEFREVMHVE